MKHYALRKMKSPLPCGAAVPMEVVSKGSTFQEYRLAAVVLASFKPYGGWAARIPVLTGAVHEARYPLAHEASGILWPGLFQPAWQGAAGQRMDMFSKPSQRNGAGRFSLEQAPGSVNGTQWTGDAPGNGNHVCRPMHGEMPSAGCWLHHCSQR